MIFKALNTSKIIVITLILSFISTSINSQTEPVASTSDFWEHIKFGGGIGLSFGDGFFSGTLAPSAVYQFNQKFSLGLGLNGTYNKLKNRYKSTIVGGSIITLVNPIQEIQLSGEFEELNVSRKYDSSLAITDENYWYPALFLGAGYRSQNFTIGIRYDVLYNANKSIYGDAWMPFVRIYF